MKYMKHEDVAWFRGELSIEIYYVTSRLILWTSWNWKKRAKLKHHDAISCIGGSDVTSRFWVVDHLHDAVPRKLQQLRLQTLDRWNGKAAGSPVFKQKLQNYDCEHSEILHCIDNELEKQGCIA